MQSVFYRRLIWVVFGVLPMLFTPAALSSPSVSSASLSKAPTLVEQRIIYQQALAQIEKKEWDAYKQTKQQLATYPLFTYVEYAEAKAKIKLMRLEHANAFLKKHKEHFLSSYFRGLWLRELVSRGEWAAYLNTYDGRKDTQLACYAWRANAKLKKLTAKELEAKAKAFWLVGHSQPSACDPVFAWLKSKGKLTDSLRWQRARLLIKRNQWQLAAAIAKPLKGTHAQQYKDWITVRKTPTHILNKRFRRDTAHNQELAVYAVKRRLNVSVAAAEKLWKTIKSRYKLNPQSEKILVRRLAVRSAQRHEKGALKRLYALPDAYVDEAVRHWRVRSALRVQDWKGVLKGYAGLKPSEQKDEQWRYWQARAQMALGQKVKANAAYAQLANNRGYYGFMAAEYSKKDYAFEHDHTKFDTLGIIELSTKKEMIRTRELLVQKQLNYARREWYLATKSFKSEQQLMAAQLAYQWGWYEQAIRMAAKSKRFDELRLRFAMPHQQWVAHYSRTQGLDPSWPQAIMRRESAYAEDAQSSVGARGLMQLMPATAKYVAKRQGWEWSNLAALNQPETNIRYGVAYLSELSKQFSGIKPLATAAYNAGPHRVKKWLPKDKDMPLDIWVETIPFRETRRYVRAVSEYMSIFNWWQAQQKTAKPLQYTQQSVSIDLMKPVKARVK